MFPASTIIQHIQSGFGMLAAHLLSREKSHLQTAVHSTDLRVFPAIGKSMVWLNFSKHDRIAPRAVAEKLSPACHALGNTAKAERHCAICTASGAGPA